MSSFSFIATDYEIPEVFNSKEKVITVREAVELGIKADIIPWDEMDPNTKIVYYKNRSDVGELVINRCTLFEDNVRWYTDKPLIYSVIFNYSEPRANQLLKYLKDNIRPGQHLELWLIWLDEKQVVQPSIFSCEEISINEIRQMYLEWWTKREIIHSCIVIEKEMK